MNDLLSESSSHWLLQFSEDFFIVEYLVLQISSTLSLAGRVAHDDLLKLIKNIDAPHASRVAYGADFPQTLSLGRTIIGDDETCEIFTAEKQYKTYILAFYR